MAGQKISTLPLVSGPIQTNDMFPMTRSGTTYRVSGDKFCTSDQYAQLFSLISQLSSNLTSLSAKVP
jgi:hypothetical protein